MKSINKETLLLYLSGKLPANKAKEVEDWIETSAENKKIAEDLYLASKLTDQLIMMKQAEAEESLAQLHAHINKKQAKKQRMRYLNILQRIAAVLFIPALILAAWWYPRQEAHDVQYVEVTANRGLTSSFTLPDNTVVWLNAGSKLKYPAHFTANQRIVNLEGEGYFEVTKNPEKPFIVTGDSAYSVEVLGTSFNVLAYRDDEYIETTLVNGSVRINYSSEGQKANLLLNPNEKAIYSKKNRQIKVVEAETEQATAWVNGKIVFNNHSMANVIKVLSRYYNVEFKVLDQRVFNSALTGSFSNESLSQVIKYIEMATGIRNKIMYQSNENKGEGTRATVELFI